MSVEYEGSGIPQQPGFTPVAPVQPAVQTPVQSAGLAGPPVAPQQYQQYQQAPPQQPAVPQQIPEGVAPPTPGVQQAAPQQQQQTVQQQIAAVASQYGFSPDQFSGFSSVQDAQAAIGLYLTQIASAGIQQGPQQYPQQYQQYPQQYPQVQVPRVLQSQQPQELPPVEIDEQLTDAKTAAALKALAARADAALERAERAERAVQQQEAQQIATLESQVKARATQAIDKIANAKYGVGGNRTFTQRLALNNVIQIAQGLANAMFNSTGQTPTIEQLIQQAVLVDGGFAQAPPPPQVQQPNLQVPSLNQPGIPPLGGPTGPLPGPQVPANGYFSPYQVNSPFGRPTPPPALEHDQDFARAALAVLARPG